MNAPKEAPPPEPARPPDAPELEEETRPAGMVDAVPDLLEDESAMLTRARARLRRDNPELHRLTRAIAARLKG
ncbi:MAG: hypothetical protein KC933_23275 [Myxococcales bacterium]|nr:hypothetical protein [Myxococcales bacterium]